MAFKDWFKRRSALQLALDRGMQPGAELADEIRALGEYTIKTVDDVDAVATVLGRIANGESGLGGDSAFHSLVGLFQDIDTDSPALEAMAERGIPVLAAIVDDRLKEPSNWDEDDLLFALKILVLYGTPEGTDIVIRAARLPLCPDRYMWSVILSAYSPTHPECERIFQELSEPLPQQFLAVALLDAGSTACRERPELSHPFDTPQGQQQLERWLTDDDDEHFSYAVSATAALMAISPPARDALLALAFDHPDSNVQLEAAWVAAKLGREAGIQWLTRACLDVNLSERAKRYLEELERTDAIPAESMRPAFQAKAQFASWLAHPNELGHPPDEVTVLDQRPLAWPPEREQRPFWLIQYRAKDPYGLKPDDIGVGVVGSITFCFFSYQFEQRPPEDCYAIHCYWEMNCAGLIAESDVPADSQEYDHLLRQNVVDGIRLTRVIHVAEPSSQLRYPGKVVALATGARDEEAGWLVLDGAQSRWYSAAELPEDNWGKTVLMLHVGRRLLDFQQEPDRASFLKRPAAAPAPADVIKSFEAILQRSREKPNLAKKVLGSHSPLQKAFKDYVSALSSERKQSVAVCTCQAYEALLASAASAGKDLEADIQDCFSPLGEAFDSYVEALVELNRDNEVVPLIEKFRPHWDHNLGYRKLGTAAFKCGQFTMAEAEFLKLRANLQDWYRCEEMAYLAEIWLRRGRVDDAHSLLLETMQQLLKSSRAAHSGDETQFEEWFQHQRRAYLRLFPERGEAELDRNGIPNSTLRQ